MSISPTQLAQALSETEISKFWLGYFQEDFRSTVHQGLVELYERAKERGLSRADLAKKIGRRPEQVTRWLSAPTNLEEDTISDMALGMGYVPKLTFHAVEHLFAGGPPNQSNPVSDFVNGQTWEISAPTTDTTGGVKTLSGRIFADAAE